MSPSLPARVASYLDPLPSQRGRVALVTGANRGLGAALTRLLAVTGARVVMACRSEARAQEARRAILDDVPDAVLDVVTFDGASLASVRACAEAVANRPDPPELLFLNAGVMAVDGRKTEDGFDVQLGVNHLAHFALTALLWPKLAEVPAARVVATTSNAAYYGRVDRDDPLRTEALDRWQAYGASKLANVLFTNALQRRFDAAGMSARAHAAHPGLVYTDLQRRADATSAPERFFLRRLVPAVGQSAAMGALPLLYAGLHPNPVGGDVWGPRWLHMRGSPRRLRAPARARDLQVQDRLWARSEAATDLVVPPAHARP